VIVTQSISVDLLDPQNDATKKTYEESFLRESTAGEGSFVKYTRVESDGRRLGGTGSSVTEAHWTLAYKDSSAAKKAAELIVSTEFTSNLAKEVGVELSAPEAEVVEEMEIVISKKPDDAPSDALGGGLRIQSDKASIAFGSKGDIKIRRIADGKLAVDTEELDISGAVKAEEIDITGAVKAKKFYIDGVSLDDYIALQVVKQINKMVEQGIVTKN